MYFHAAGYITKADATLEKKVKNIFIKAKHRP